MPRVVDLSLSTAAHPGAAPYYPPPHYSHHEYLDETFHRSELMGLLDVAKVDLGGPVRTSSEVTMSVDPMGSHAELYWLDDRVMFGTLPSEKRWLIRDVAQLPVQRMVGPAAIVDLTDFGAGDEVHVDDLEQRAAHVRSDDIVILKTGYSNRVNEQGLKFAQANYSGSPGLSPQAGQWLADRGIKALGMDSRSPEVEAKVWADPDREISFPVHRTMHDIGAVLIEDLTNVTAIEGNRVWAACALPLKTEALSGGPARMIVLDGDTVRDITNPSFSHPRPLPDADAPGRPEDWRYRGDLYRRLRIQKISFTGLRYGYPGKMADWAEYVTFSSRVGTHIVMPGPGLSGPDGELAEPATLPPDRLFGRARVLRLADAGAGRPITAAQLEREAGDLQPEEALVLRTDYADWNYPLASYHRRSPYLAEDAAAWLTERAPRLLVCDFPSVDADDRWLAGEREQELLMAGVPIVYSAGNLWLLRSDRLNLACLPLAVKGLEAAPARLIAVEGDIRPE